MNGKHGIVAVCVVVLLGAICGSVRADSILTLNPPNGGNRGLIVMDLAVTFTPTANPTPGSPDAYGVFTVSALTGTSGILKDSVLFPGTGNQGPVTGFLAAQPPTTTLIGGTLDVAPSGTATFSSGTMNVDGKIFGAISPTNFISSTNESAFAINLSGSAVDPMAFMFALGTSGYYGGPNEQYVVGQLTGSPGAGNPMSISNFFTASGAPTTGVQNWTGDFKLDLFAEPLPLPVPLVLGTVMLVGFAGTKVFVKRRRPMASR